MSDREESQQSHVARMSFHPNEIGAFSYVLIEGERPMTLEDKVTPFDSFFSVARFCFIPTSA